MKKLFIILVALFAFAACKNDNSFKGEGKKKDREINNQSTPQDQEAIPQPITPTDTCVEDNVSNYNFVLVFDASRSQLEFDPGNVRGSGATAFLNKLLTLKQREKEANFNVSFIRFSSSPAAGMHGWIPVGPDKMSILANEVLAATQNPSGSTYYVPALELAGSSLQRAPTGGKGQRNYVVFLTDGEPHDQVSSINNIVQRLVADFKAAMIVIAAGGNLASTGLGTVQNMAQPTNGIAGDPKHVGRYKHAQSAQELASVWDETFKDVFKCQNQNGTGTTSGTTF